MANLLRMCDDFNIMRPKTAATSTSSERSTHAELVAAAIGLLNDHGPDALQTRKIAAAAGTSTMAVYTYFGGMRALIAEVAEEGLRQFGQMQADVEETDDPIADFLVTGFAYRKFAIDYPHMYRLMFGITSAHGINAPSRNMFETPDSTPDHPAALHLIEGVRRAAAAGRIKGSPTDMATLKAVAAQFWTVMHGFVMLELAGFWGHEGAAVGPVLGSMTIDILVALGDSRENVMQSLAVATKRIAETLTG